MAMVNEIFLTFGHGDLAEGGLEGDSVRLKILHEPAPPVRFPFDNVAEFRFRNAVSQTRFHQHFPADATTTQRLRQCAGEFFAAARRALVNGNNGHGFNLLLRLEFNFMPAARSPRGAHDDSWLWTDLQRGVLAPEIGGHHGRSK